MSKPSDPEVTRLLKTWNLGESSALETLIPLVYGELHRLAHLYMSRERPGHELQTTALVHEAFLKLANMHRIDWANRKQFFGVSANLMRQVLVDIARARQARKRGGGAVRVTLKDGMSGFSTLDPDILELDEALRMLASMDTRKARVVELRYFGGLSVQETAELLGVSEETVMRDWKFAKAWLLRALRQPAPS